MPDPIRSQAENSASFNPIFADGLKPSQSPDVSAFQRIDTSGAELVPAKLQNRCVRLDMEDLQPFETLNHQYEEWGVTFHNAIALEPSNPAFPSRTGKMVVIGSPRNGWIEATFQYPVSCVNSFVTSSRRLVLSAFDACDRPIGYVELDAANLATSNTSNTKRKANTQLTLHAANIHRITLSCMDGQLTLDELSFSA